MLSLALVLLAVGQTPLTAEQGAAMLTGKWLLDGNGHRGGLSLSATERGQVSGKMYGDLVVGTVDFKSREVVLKRLSVAHDGEKTTVQIYTGKLSPVEKSDPPRYQLVGTFESAGDPYWGAPGVAYDWNAQRDAAPGRGMELRELAGRWEVLSAGATNEHQVLPREHPLSRTGAVVEIRGNQISQNGQSMGALANDVYCPTLDLEENLRYERRLLILTLPDGRAYLCSYKINADTLEITYPFTMGRIAAGQFIYLKRQAQE